MVLFGCELYLAAPLAVAFYPQYGSIKKEELEPELLENFRKKNDGAKLPEMFKFNKGL